jgi:hypothetical protein
MKYINYNNIGAIIIIALMVYECGYGGFCANDEYLHLAIEGIIIRKERRNTAPYRNPLFMVIQTSKDTFSFQERGYGFYDWEIGDSIIKTQNSLLFRYKSKKDGNWYTNSWECEKLFGK